MISLFSFPYTGPAFMVIMQFRGRLVRHYRACVVDSLGLGITCVISLYYVYKASQSCLLCFLCHPYIPHYNFLFTCLLSDLITILLIILVQVSIQQCYEQPKKYYVVGNSCTCTCIRREMHVYTGDLLANNVHCILT